MRCPQCRGPIERPGAICPHCGVALSGLTKLRTKLEASDKNAGHPASKSTPGRADCDIDASALFIRIKALVLRDTRTTVITGMACGAILGRIVGFGWVIGAIVGGFATYKFLESK